MLLAVVLLAGFLRFWQIGEPEVWLDEIAVRKDAIAGTNASVSRTHNVHLWPVGFLLRTVGDTPSVLRSWGALLSTASVAVAFALGCWVRGRRLGVIMAVLVAANPYLVVYAQDGNYYSGMFLFAAVQLCGFAWVLRGAVKGGLVIIGAAGALSYYNHPMSICLTAMLVAGAVGAVCVSAPLRARALPRWVARLPAAASGVVLLVCLGVAALALGPRFAHALEFVLSKLSPGGALTNVEFGFPFFEGLYTSWGIAHFRPHAAPAETLAWLPFALSLAGAALLLRQGRRSRVAAGFGCLCVLAPIATYLFIFNINVRRGFYIRYLTFLLPLFLLGVGVALHAMARAVPALRSGWRLVPVAATPILAIWSWSLALYYQADTRNFNVLVHELGSRYRKGDLVWNTDQWLRVHTWFPPAGLPDWDDANVQTTLLRRETADLLPHAFAVMAWGRPEGVWINSSWREAPTADALGAIDSMQSPVFSGTSGQGPTQDAQLGKWDNSAVHAFPTLAVPVPIAGTAIMAIRAPGVAPAAPRPSVPTPGGLLEPPQLATLPVTLAASWPDHSSVRVERDGDSIRGFRERDGSWEFPLYGEGSHTRLELLAVRRSPGDMEPAPGRAAQSQLDPALLLAVAIDGVHRGVFAVPPGEPGEPFDINTGLRVPMGNHRVSVTGFTPRRTFTPYNPWRFRGIAVRPAGEGDKPAETVDGDLRLVGPVPALQSPRLDGGWTLRGRRYPAGPDPAMPSPSGREPLRIDFPAEADGSATLLSPPFPVEGGTTLAFSVHLSASTMTRKEALPCTQFFDSNGRPIAGSQYSLKPAITGSLWPCTWRRYAEFVPVPKEARSARVGVAVFPREISFSPRAGSLWIDAFAAHDADVAWRDPVNPRLMEVGR